jgi:hypothetical protein
MRLKTIGPAKLTKYASESAKTVVDLALFPKDTQPTRLDANHDENDPNKTVHSTAVASDQER